MMFALLIVLTWMSSWMHATELTPDEHEDFVLQCARDKMVWSQKYHNGAHFDKDPLYYQDAILMHSLYRAVYFGPPCCQRSVLNELFSMVRCATCYSMVLNNNVGPCLFLQVLEKCFKREVYQVFVATDSYYNGTTPTQKSRILKNKALAFLPVVPERGDLNKTGDLFATLPWLRKSFPHVHSSLEQPPPGF